MSKSDIEALTWVRQATDTQNTRYALGGVCFNPQAATVTGTNGVAILRAELNIEFSNLLAEALELKDDETRILFSSGKLSWSWDLNNAISKLNSENISICGNPFRISTERFPNVQSFFDAIPSYDIPKGGFAPMVDPHYASMFFPKRTKNSPASCDNPPSVKIHSEDTWNQFTHPVYFRADCFSFPAYGFVSPFRYN
jgi:hypothetical protein